MSLRVNQQITILCSVQTVLHFLDNAARAALLYCVDPDHQTVTERSARLQFRPLRCWDLRWHNHVTGCHSLPTSARTVSASTSCITTHHNTMRVIPVRNVLRRAALPRYQCPEIAPSARGRKAVQCTATPYRAHLHSTVD